MKLSVILSAVVALSTARCGYQVKAAPSHGYQGPPAPLARDGTVLDTPEVAQAKAAHLAAHAAALAWASGHAHQVQHDQGQYRGYDNGDNGAYKGENTHAQYQSHSHVRTPTYQGPAAPLAHDGRVVDTPEVAQAKAAHLAAHAHALSRANQLHYNGAYEGAAQYRGQGYAVPVQVPVQVPIHQVTYAQTAPVKYQGPFAPLGQDGRVIDTPEVAEAKAAHLQAYAHAAALTTGQVRAPMEANVYTPAPVEEHVYAPAPTEAQVRDPAESQFRAPNEAHYGAPETQFRSSLSAEAQFRGPNEALYGAPEAQFRSSAESHGSSEAQVDAPAEAQVHEPSAEGEHSYEERYY